MTFKMALLTGTLAVTGIVVDAGFINVRVHEKKQDGTNIRLIVPAILAPVGLKVLPEKELEKMSREMRDVLPALTVAARELQNIPDGPLVEVISPDEQVRVAKEGDSIVVDVNSRGETVHVSVPLKMIHSMASELEARAASQGNSREAKWF